MAQQGVGLVIKTDGQCLILTVKEEKQHKLSSDYHTCAHTNVLPRAHKNTRNEYTHINIYIIKKLLI